jgi:hypothetical protein
MSQVQDAPLAGEALFRANVAVIQRLAKAYGSHLKPTDVADAIANGADTQKFNDLIMERMTSGATDATTLAGLGATQREQRQYSFLRAIQMQIPGANVDAGFEREVSQAIGRGGQNVRLASQLTGWNINVMSLEEQQAKQEHGI